MIPWSPQKHQNPNSRIWFIKDSVSHSEDKYIYIQGVRSLVCNYGYWKFSKFRIFWLSEQPAASHHDLQFQPFPLCCSCSMVPVQCDAVCRGCVLDKCSINYKLWQFLHHCVTWRWSLTWSGSLIITSFSTNISTAASFVSLNYISSNYAS